MQMTVVRPSARLAALVDRFTIVEAEREATRVLLPECGLVIGVRYRGAATLIDGARAARMADSVVTGVLAGARTITTHGGSGIVVAQLRPAGAARFFAQPLHELFGKHVPLDAVIAPADAARLGDEVSAARSHADRVAALERFLIARVRGGVDLAMVRAADALAASHGALRIAALADELGLGQDALEKRFRRAIGASPKQLAQLLRVRHAIALGRAGASWSRVALAAGYCDQSHFIREFRAVTGSPPVRFFRDVAHC